MFDSLLFSVPKSPTIQSIREIPEWCIFTDKNGYDIDYLCFPSTGRKLLLFLHGCGFDLSSIYHPLKNTAHRISKDGYTVICAEYPGFGRSSLSIEPSEEFLLKTYPSQLNELITSLGYNWCDVIVVGHSVGTSVAMYLSSRYPVGSMVLVSSFISIKNIVCDILGIFGVWYSDHFDNTDIVNYIRCPTYIVHGSADWLICPHHSEWLFHRIPFAPKKKFYLLQGMNHNIDWDLFYNQVFRDICS